MLGRHVDVVVPLRILTLGSGFDFYEILIDALTINSLKWISLCSLSFLFLFLCETLALREEAPIHSEGLGEPSHPFVCFTSSSEYES